MNFLTNKKNLVTLLSIFLLIIVPFSVSNRSDDIFPVEISKESIGYYQSTTCKISFGEFLSKNINESKSLYFNNNNYADINCFGKITGVDESSDKIIVSIGTNTSINLIIQSLIWILIFSFIPKHKEEKMTFYSPILIIPFVFTFQFFAESRFYSRSNIIFDDTLSLKNYFLLGNLLFFIFLTYSTFDTLKYRYKNIINFLPLIFLFVGTYVGMNLNIYLFILSIFGLISFRFLNSFGKFDLLYISVSFYWIFSTAKNDYFFDGDKLRGFNNSSYTAYSQLFWITVLFLSIRGCIFIFQKSKENFNLDQFINCSLVTGSVIFFLGLFGSISSFVNFFNFYFFGQNKRGMKEVSSIEGNTWRGFSASAESIGEFYGVILLIVFISMFYKIYKINTSTIFLIPIVVFGLYRSNNFASFISLIVLIIFVVLVNSQKYKLRKSFYNKLLLTTLVFFGITIFNSFDYEYASTELLYEATLHHDFYTDTNDYRSYKRIEEKMIERDLNSILLNNENNLKASSTYKLMLNIFTQDFNIPLIPNIIAMLSFVSLLINRTEMWGIFIAKYNPNFFESLFGHGPLQLNKYLYSHKVNLDVPKNEVNSLFLPHSSILDILIFFGFLGLITLTILFIKFCFNSPKNNIFYLPTIFFIINFLKSDSILYMSSLFFLIFLIVMGKEDSIKNEK